MCESTIEFVDKLREFAVEAMGRTQNHLSDQAGHLCSTARILAKACTNLGEKAVIVQAEHHLYNLANKQWAERDKPPAPIAIELLKIADTLERIVNSTLSNKHDDDFENKIRNMPPQALKVVRYFRNRDTASLNDFYKAVWGERMPGGSSTDIKMTHERVRGACKKSNKLTIFGLQWKLEKRGQYIRKIHLSKGPQ